MTRRGDWIQTVSGKKVYPLDPRSEDFCIEDIAHSLSMLCRFVGHCREFYSVAQHSVLVAEQLPKELQIWGLLHDAAEAYVSDVSRPIKRYIKVDGDSFKIVELRILLAIAEAFDLELPESWSEIELADLRMLKTEARDLMSHNANDTWESIKNVPPLEKKIVPWSSAAAKAGFLTTWEFLKYKQTAKRLQ